MPFKSVAQQHFMFAKHPKVAQKWADKYGVPSDLPKKLSKGKGKKNVKK